MKGFNWFRDNGHAAHAVRAVDVKVGVDDIVDRILSENRSPVTVALGFSHNAPGWDLSAAEAHRLMRLHLRCSGANCDRKAAAWRTLVEAGKIRPDAGRVTWTPSIPLPDRRGG